MITEYIKDMKVVPMPWTTTGMKAMIAAGTLVPPPGPVSRPLEHILAWLAAGAILIILGLLGVLYGSWRA